VTFNGIPAVVLFASPSQVNLLIPAGLAPGPATMSLSNALGASYPVDVNIDPAPSALAGLLNSSGGSIDVNHPAHSGDVVTLLLANFADPSTTVAASRVQITINGQNAPALLVAPYASGLFQIQTVLPSLPSGSDPVSVSLDGRTTAQGSIPIQ
jgi:uncharacterized protein (TIGR03437 family)